MRPYLGNRLGQPTNGVKEKREGVNPSPTLAICENQEGRLRLLLLLAGMGVEIAPDCPKQAQDCNKEHDLIKRLKSESHLLPLTIKPIGP